MSSHKYHTMAFIATSLFAGAIWAANFSSHAMTQAGACPTPVKNNEKNTHPESMNPENRGCVITEKQTCQWGRHDLPGSRGRRECVESPRARTLNVDRIKDWPKWRRCDQGAQRYGSQSGCVL